MSTEIGSIIPAIDCLAHTFTKSERIIADLIRSDPSAIVYTTINELSARAGVGDTTVVRFCRKLGFKGYHDFKIALTQEVSKIDPAEQELSETIEIDDSITSLMKKIINLNFKALNETLLLISTEHVNRAVDYICNCENLFFYGIGFSGFSALEAKLKFMRVGVRCDAITDGHIMAMNAATLGPRDVAIGISYSGSSKDTVDSLQAARNAQAKTISITHSIRSPITTHSDAVLLTGSRENVLQSGLLSPRAAQLFVINLIYTEFLRRNYEKASTIQKSTIKAISDKMYY